MATTAPLTQRSRKVSNKKMTLMERIYLPAIVKGMAITLKHFFTIKKATLKYPEQKKAFSGIYRGLHVLKRDDQGRERCTACGLCAVACPEEKLYREEKYAAIYEINMLRCIFCGDCEEACPKEAIFLTDRLVPTDYTRKPFVYGKEWLVEPLDPALRVDVSKRQTPEVLKFKQQKQYSHNR